MIEKEKPFKYHKEEYEGMISYLCNTDFSKYSYKPDFILFKIGNFRGYEKNAVVMVSDIMKPLSDRRKYFIFNSNLDGIRFILNSIRKMKENFNQK